MWAASELRTERLLLRRARAEDAVALNAVFSDPLAMRYWSSVPHPDIETTRTWLASMIEAEPETSDDFIVELDGQVIGKAGAWRLPEVGYIIGREHWGKGYAREALGAFIAHAFAHRTDHLKADVDPRNERSLKLLLTLGFRETHRAPRTWEVGGEWCDSVYLRLDKPPPSSRP
jgi:[ribosomal protein S5]-alanine N-acetyltransferase